MSEYFEIVKNELIIFNPILFCHMKPKPNPTKGVFGSSDYDMKRFVPFPIAKISPPEASDKKEERK